MINKIDLAPLVGADRSVMERDARHLRGEAPTFFTSVLHGTGMETVASWVREAAEHRDWIPNTSPRQARPPCSPPHASRAR